MPQDRAFSRVRVSIVVVAFALGTALAAPAPDARAGPTDAPDNELLLEEIPSVFAASNFEQKLSEAPAAVSLVTEEEIRRFGYRTLGEILASVVGVYSTDDRNYQYLGVRGLGVSGDYNARVLILIDGHRLNDALYSAVLIGRGFPLDVELIDRVEIVRGASSALHGNNAFLAVVNVITRRGSALRGGEVEGSYGSYGTHHLRTTYGDRLANGLEYLVSASRFASAGERKLFYREFDSPATRFGVASHADAETAERVFARIAYGDFVSQLGYGERHKEIPTAPFDTVFGDDDTRTRDAYGWVDLSHRAALGDSFSLESRAYWDWYGFHGRYLYDSDPGPGLSEASNDDTGDARRAGASFALSGTPFDSHRISLGLDLVWNYRLAQTNRDRFPETRYLDSDTRAFDWGFYVQDAVELGANLTLLLGARFDAYDLSDQSLNPRVGLVWQATPETTWKVLYGSAFRAPNAYELFYAVPDDQKPSGSLDPEEVETFELIAERRLGESLRLTGSLYHSRIDDLIALVPDPSDGLNANVNADGLRSYGFETGLEGGWASGWKTRASFGVQRTEERRSRARWPNSPAVQVKLGVVAPLFAHRLFVSPEFQYTSNRESVFGAKAGEVLLTHLTFDAPNVFLGRGSLQGGVRNLFDRRYFDPGTTGHTQLRIEQTGRTFFLAGRFAF